MSAWRFLTETFNFATSLNYETMHMPQPFATGFKRGHSGTGSIGRGLYQGAFDSRESAIVACSYPPPCPNYCARPLGPWSWTSRRRSRYVLR